MARHKFPLSISTECCIQCGTPGRDFQWVHTEHGLCCAVCAFRQQEHDERRENFEYLTPSSLGFLSDTE